MYWGQSASIFSPTDKHLRRPGVLLVLEALPILLQASHHHLTRSIPLEIKPEGRIGEITCPRVANLSSFAATPPFNCEGKKGENVVSIVAITFDNDSQEHSLL